MDIGTPDRSPSDARVQILALGRAQLVSAMSAPEDKSLLEGGKPLALLVYLACSPARQARRELLIDLLWADLEPDAAKHALRQTLWYIKKRAGDGLLVATGDVLRLTDRVEIDRDALLAAAEASDLARVVELYAGDFLPGFAAPGGAEFEGWADLERRRLRSVFVRAVEFITHDLLRAGKTREAVALARRARQADPTHQGSWRLVIEALVAGRDWPQAQAECDAFERQLAEEEVEPEPASRAVVRLARQGEEVEGAGETSQARLTAQLVGREREFASLLDAVAQAQRGRGHHVHLRGAAGLGKSRLLGDLLIRLRSARVRVVLVRCDASGREVPFSAASDLALALGQLPGARGISPDSAAALVAMAPALSSDFPVAIDRSTGSEALRRRCQALAELATAVAEDKAMVMLVDDVHWMDASSRTVIGHVMARLAGHRLLLVTAGRPVVEGRLEDAEAHDLELRALTEGEVAELVGSVASLGSEGWGGALVHELWRAAGGSPLLVVETLQLLRERELLLPERGEWRAPAPEAALALLREGGALARRIDALRRDQRWLLTLLSVAGSPLGDDLLQAAAGVGAGEVAEGMNALERRGLAARSGAGWVIIHDELALTVLERTSSDGLRAAHVMLGKRFWQGASDDVATMRRAAQHLAQGHERAPRDAVFQRFVRRMRALGDSRPLALLAEELLGRHATPGVVRELVTSLPWYVRFGLTSTRRVAAVAAVVVALAMLPASFLLVRAASPAPPVPVAELLLVEVAEGARHIWRVPLLSGEWVPGRPIQVTSAGERPVGDPWVNWPVVEHPLEPGTWLSSRSVNDSGVIDLFLEGPKVQRRITAARGDDLLGDVSPDGRRAVLATGRWNADSHYDIAVVDLATGAAHAVTRGAESDEHPRWSHDGDRIAFVRRDWADDSRRLCVVNPDGSDLFCPPTWVGVTLVLGWVDGDRLLMMRESASGRDLVVGDLRDGRFESLGERVREAPTLSPDGRWIACQCERIGYDDGTWFVMPLGRGAEARPVTLPEGVSAARLAFTTVGRPPTISVLTIDNGLGTPAVGVPHLFSARGVVGDHLTPRLARVRWHSSQPAILSIDSLSGVATPHQPGRSTIRAELPGWASVTREVDVRADVAHEVLSETWDAGWAERWFDFGTPRPVVVTVDGTMALNVNGDGSFHSGVISHGAFDVSRGLAVELELAVRLTKPQWQSIGVTIVPARDLRTIAPDERATGALRTVSAGIGECGLSIPAGEGVTRAGAMLVSLGRQPHASPLPPGVADGRRVRVRLQLLPDGRCGVAVGDRERWVSRAPMALPGSVQLTIIGSADETQAMATGVRVWTGVRAGIDWGTAESR